MPIAAYQQMTRKSPLVLVNYKTTFIDDKL